MNRKRGGWRISYRRGWARCRPNDTGIMRQATHAALVSKLSKAEREARRRGGGLMEIMLSIDEEGVEKNAKKNKERNKNAVARLD